MTNYSFNVLSYEEFANSLSTNKNFIYGLNSYFYKLPFKYTESNDKWIAIQYQRGRLFAMYIHSKYPNYSFERWEMGYFNNNAKQDVYEAINLGVII